MTDKQECALKLPIGAKWSLWNIKSFEIEIVGNIFDNPELLESEG